MIRNIDYLKCLKMNRAFVLIFLLISIGCNLDKPQSNKRLKVFKKTKDKIVDDSFDIKLQIDGVGENLYNLATTIVLKNGSYVISPFSKDDIYGHFSISIAKSDALIVRETMLEMPNSIEEFDSIIEKPVKFVRVNTSYKQQVKVMTKEEFEVSGLIEFVLEPSCVPYDVEFIISQHSGKLQVKKTKTAISAEYKL